LLIPENANVRIRVRNCVSQIPRFEPEFINWGVRNWNSMVTSIRIREAQKHTDPTDPDPQHCFNLTYLVVLLFFSYDSNKKVFFSFHDLPVAGFEDSQGRPSCSSQLPRTACRCPAPRQSPACRPRSPLSDPAPGRRPPRPRSLRRRSGREPIGGREGDGL
jgi:hypothetical protein